MLGPGKKGSIPNSISPDGSTYGCDHNDDYFTLMVGFGRIGSDKYIAALDAGGGELSNPHAQVLGSMNNGGTPNGAIIVGLYVSPPDSGSQYHGYVVRSGKFHSCDILGSVETQRPASAVKTDSGTPEIKPLSIRSSQGGGTLCIA